MSKEFATCVHQGRYVGTVKVCCRTNLLKFTSAYVCPLYTRCLPVWSGPWDATQQENEAKNYTLCHLHDGTHCKDYQAKE